MLITPFGSLGARFRSLNNSSKIQKAPLTLSFASFDPTHFQ